MTINTKFNVGDEVVFISNDRFFKRPICSIRITSGSDWTRIEYLFNPPTSNLPAMLVTREESEVYGSIDNVVEAMVS
jgi:hypothetical protein